MSLWGNIDYSNGNNKPKFANTTNVWSVSTIHGSKANTAKYYGQVVGVSATELPNASVPGVAHAGWVSQKVGTGPISSINLISGGAGYNSSGYFTISDDSVTGTGIGANISYSIANALNVLQSYSSNAWNNTIVSINVVSGGSGYSNSSAITLSVAGTPITEASYTVVLGGRGDRVNYETLVAMGSVSGDDPRDNVWFPGV
jgi:hypothetical protein